MAGKSLIVPIIPRGSGGVCGGEGGGGGLVYYSTISNDL